MKILFIKLRELGGVLRTVPLFRGLKDKYPSSELIIVTKKNAFSLLDSNPDIDRLISWEGDLNSLLKEEFDWVINTEDDDETCSFISKITTKKLTGPYKDQENVIRYTKDSSPWYDLGKISRFGLDEANKLKKASQKSYVETYCTILDLPKESYPLVLPLTEKEESGSQNFIKLHKKSPKDILVGVNTGAGGNWPLKALSLEKTIHLITLLYNKGFKVVLLGGPEEKERNLEIVKKLSFKIIDSGTENSLESFISIINSLDILVTSDTLALHLGVALNKRVVSFFGPTSAEEIDLYDNGVKVIPDSDCYCCFKKGRDKEKMCIDFIEPTRLLEEVLKQKRLL